MTPQEASELDQTVMLFHGALVALGAQSVAGSLDLWQDVPPLPTTGGARAAQRWLTTATALVMRQRIKARDMALAFYRYERALATGSTIALPGQAPESNMTLFQLKRQFEAIIGMNTQTPGGLEDRDVEVESIDGLKEDLDALEAEAEDRTRENLSVLGTDGMNRSIRKAREEAERTEATLDTVDQGRIAAHASAGNRQAAAAERNAMNGGRAALFVVGDKDPKVLGFIRASMTGTPCGFCAMLISRGPVLKGVDRQASIYASREGTGLRSDGTIVTYGDMDLYHDNCHCYAVPVMSLEHFRTSPTFDLNRKYAELWPIVTKGLGGEGALRAWRRFIREEAKQRKPQAAAA